MASRAGSNMAFTPINSSDTINDSPGSYATASNEESTAPNDEASSTVASAYLGRGDVSRKAATKGKKRSSTTAAPSKAKRRQTSDFNDDLKVIKAGSADRSDDVNNETLVPATSQAASSKSSEETAHTATKPASAGAPVSTTVDELASTAAKPISVYSSKTTMDALDSTSVRTSVQFAKASDGQGFTLLQGISSAVSYSSSVAIAKPLMAEKQPSSGRTKKRAGQHSDEAGTSNRRSARLKKAFDVPTGSPQSSDSIGSPRLPLIVGDFEEDFDDIDMEELTGIDDNEPEFRPNTPPNRGRKLNTREVDELEDYGGALLSEADRRALGRTGSESAVEIEGP